MQNNSKASIREVKKFWNSNPLFIGETTKKIGSKSFFDEHDQTIIKKIFFGKKNILKKILFPNSKIKNKVLDLGCGIGFWLSFMEDNFNYDLYGSDISSNSIKIAKKRVSKNVKFNLQKDEHLSFPNNYFNHVNCQGVLHHTTSPKILLSEIFRVLKNKGTSSISVYYENIFLKNYEYFYYLIKPLVFLFQNKGRGRNFQKLPKNKFELVKLYDGKNNPIGYALSKKEIKKLLINAGFKIIDYRFYFFPVRFLKISLPNFINNILANFLPFMIIINVKK